ncbi:Retrovirus-related Pol polyprotein from transposon TNT 1-94 [Podarcis lilfordi]|uniref:Retrovirus-related Pol polyprotein from transposon TNT 1-94 n=1 Tax=Podarcis lilfordi TaxID=74358 RepID=A0AA35LN36_9SAUR|nr:Retrovirus-related Pol polyprotein from transposon TNT 1-94 [Podarcis lilfordi]
MEQSRAGILLEKLTATNYSIWLVCMQHFLKSEGLWKVVEDPPQPPEEDEDDDEKLAQAESQLEKDEKALATIILEVDDSQLVYVADKVTASEAWNALKAVHVREAAGLLITLTRRMYWCRIKLGDSLVNHLKFLTGCFQELALRGRPVEEEDKVFIVLSSLDDSYDMLVNSLELVETDKLTLEYVTGRLYAEEDRHAKRKMTSAQLLEHPRGNNSREQQRCREPEKQPGGAAADQPVVNKVKRCFCCKSSGHLLRDCPRKQQKQQKHRRQQRESTTWVSADGQENEELWVLDSGASQTFCKRKALLTDARASNKKHTDRGGEFMASSLRNWLQSQGIKHRTTNVATPQENGVAERRGGVLQTQMKALLADANLPKYWAESIKTANYIGNRLWSRVLDNIPYKILYNKSPSLQHLRIFGTKAWVDIPVKKRRKGGKRAQQLLFLGYESGTKSYKFEDNKNLLSYSQSASFNEQRNWPKIHANQLPEKVLLLSVPDKAGETKLRIGSTPREIEREGVKTEQFSPAACMEQGGGEKVQPGQEEVNLQSHSTPKAVLKVAQGVRLMNQGGLKEVIKVNLQSIMGSQSP